MVPFIVTLLACGLSSPDPDFDGEPPRDPMSTVADGHENGAVQPASANADLKDGEPGVHQLSPDGRATITLKTADDRVLGNLTAQPEGEGLRIQGRVTGLEPNSKHGFHVHEGNTCGDGSDGFEVAGGHFAPEKHPHGAPDADQHHAGDLGNIQADGDGVAMVDILADDLDLRGDHGVGDRAMVLHAGTDDLTSQPSGDAGSRLACGTFEVSAR